jgi:HSP20 family protein
MDDIQLELTGNELSLRGERRAVQGDGLNYHRRERGTARFARVLRLPYDVDAQKVNATFENGVLLVELPKSEAARPRRIQVKSQSR